MQKYRKNAKLQIADGNRQFKEMKDICIKHDIPVIVVEAPDRIMEQLAFITNYAKLNIDRNGIGATDIYASKMSIK